MKNIKHISFLLLFVAIFQRDVLAQIKTISDYNLNYGNLEEIKLEDLDSDPKSNFDFKVGDTIYWVPTSTSTSKSESEYSYLCYDKIANDVTFKKIQADHFYVVNRIFFGDTISNLITWFDNQFTKQLSENPKAYLGYKTRGRHYRISDYMAVYGKEKAVEIRDRKYWDIIYRLEDENGDFYYICNDDYDVVPSGLIPDPEIGLESSLEMYNLPQHSDNLIFLKLSDYYEIEKRFVGKFFYMMSDRGMPDSVAFYDYISRKKLVLKTPRKYKVTNDEGMFAPYKGLENYVQCKGLFLHCGNYVAVFGNDLGEFSAAISPLWHSKEILLYTPYSKDSGGYDLTWRILPKDEYDNMVKEQMMSEKEKIMKRQKEEQEYAARQKKHKADIIAKYGEKYGNMIIQHKVGIGMSKEMCKEAGWYPRETYKTTTSMGTSEVWVINYKTALYFYDGKLYMIEN